MSAGRWHHCRHTASFTGFGTIHTEPIPVLYTYRPAQTWLCRSFWSWIEVLRLRAGRGVPLLCHVLWAVVQYSSPGGFRKAWAARWGLKLVLRLCFVTFEGKGGLIYACRNMSQRRAGTCTSFTGLIPDLAYFACPDTEFEEEEPCKEELEPVGCSWRTAGQCTAYKKEKYILS